jgi:hypothetical protein
VLDQVVHAAAGDGLLRIDRDEVGDFAFGCVRIESRAMR